MAKRASPPPSAQPEQSLQHDYDRESGQPYAKEVVDYGQGVTTPPKQQRGWETHVRTTKGRAEK